MLIVGELINTSRKAMREAVEARNDQYIAEIAKKQDEAGADYIDVNCGNMVGKEPEIMEWLVKIIQGVTNKPLCIDSPNPVALEVGLSLAKSGQPMVNSISAEKDRFDQILPLIQKYKAKIVGLCIDDSGMPETAEDRLRAARRLVPDLMASGIPQKDIHLDPLVKPVGTGDLAGVEVLESAKHIRQEFPEVHFMCGLSNVSYGLPNRKILNQAFMILTMGAGLDGYILDPLDKVMMGFCYAAQTLLGKDVYCRKYLEAYRNGLYEK